MTHETNLLYNNQSTVQSLYRKSTPTVVTAATLQPLTLTEVKKHLEIDDDDSEHNTQLESMIDEACEQWESDTDSICMQRTLRITTNEFYDDFKLPLRPITSITSLKYYDLNNVQQTLATTVYGFDAANRSIRLKTNQSLPTFTPRWDAFEITYAAGHATAATIPALWKRAMLLLIAYYFDSNRGDNDRLYDMKNYERLVLKCMRNTYP